ncbi:YadA family autotransporter adhesin [Burkholderia gladioli]|uniref:YadA-like family protein n=1 Tax=Burkholderia gladioli TaxID=28095 RepID=A0AB38TMR9_BURGA|nr:YadA-like family protein [Burkholderia gladioli]MBU9268787.1 YadA-like family protein [Burkholderia gladioli]UWX69055.1 YadA-like family protein [Burkholderia gladioli]
MDKHDSGKWRQAAPPPSFRGQLDVATQAQAGHEAWPWSVGSGRSRTVEAVLACFVLLGIESLGTAGASGRQGEAICKFITRGQTDESFDLSGILSCVCRDACHPGQARLSPRQATKPGDPPSQGVDLSLNESIVADGRSASSSIVQRATQASMLPGTEELERASGETGSQSVASGQLDSRVSTLQSRLSTGLASASREAGVFANGVRMNEQDLALLSTATSTQLDAITAEMSELSSVDEFHAKRIDTVSRQLDSTDVRLRALAERMSPLMRANDEARRNGNVVLATAAGGGEGRMIETRGPGTDAVRRSRIDPAGCTLANGFDATATGLCAAAGTIAGRDGARESRRADGATAYGAYARAREHHATALGFRALAARDGAVAIGYQAGALGAQATALGDGARADGDRSVALGASALATGRGAVALGAGSIADRDATVSIGSPGRERRLVNLAPGVAPGDAVNLSQLATLGRSLEDVARRAYTGVAMSMAMSGLYLPSLNPGEVAAGVGVGGFSGYRAIALNLKGLAGNGRLGWGAGVSTTGRLTGFNLGAGWKW